MIFVFNLNTPVETHGRASLCKKTSCVSVKKRRASLCKRNAARSHINAMHLHKSIKFQFSCKWRCKKNSKYLIKRKKVFIFALAKKDGRVAQLDRATAF